MCGICGIVDPLHRMGEIVDMNDAQRHRGPDDEGYLFVNSRSGERRVAAGDDSSASADLIHHSALRLEQYDVAFGSRRLAILDLSPAGRMPMSYRDGSLWITYNGEVYNHVELRQTLRALGCRFTNETDTEVILAAYATWGEECLTRLNGMFAFAIWDHERRRLFCARDHFGIKPFYYRWDGRTLAFASEIKALLLHPSVPKEPDDQAIFDYLVRGVCDHEERTFFQGIVPLPAGHALTLDAASAKLSVRRWWDIALNREVGRPDGTDSDRCAEFRHMLRDAVRIRLRSDVPIGTCLSGGLDSSSIVCLANDVLLRENVIAPHLVGAHQKTFTARNREAEIDEYAYSRMIVERTAAEEHLVTPDAEQLWRELETFIWYMDEPFSSTSQYPQWNVMRLARQTGVTVLLDGQGGDELLAGYHSYLPVYVKQVAREQGMLAGLRAAREVSQIGGAAARNTLYRELSMALPWRAKQMLHAIRPPKAGAGTGGSGVSDAQLDPDFRSRFAVRLHADPTRLGLAGLLYRDLTATNLPMLLRYEDRNSMAFSIESRLPFLDPRLVEFTFSLPVNFRIRQGWTKWILRESLKDVLPGEIAWRRSKLGFPTPEIRWLAAGAGFIRRLLDPRKSPYVRRFVHADVLRQLQTLPDFAIASLPGIWRLINLELWFQVYFERTGRRMAVDPDHLTSVAI